MSGLAGIVCSKGCPEEEHTRLLEKMCEIQAHRGPDDRRVVSLGRVALGATHLRIVDLSPAASQPLQTEDEGAWIVFDGTLYNYRALRDELLASGHRFRTEGDVEVVLHAYRQWGRACLDRFDGIFAFAVHERRNGTTTLVRDHFGVKVLLTGDSIGPGFGMYAGRMRVERWLTPARGVFRHLPRGISRALAKAVYRSKSLPVASPGFVEDLPAAVHFIDRYRRMGRRRRYEQAYGFVDDPVTRAILVTKMADLTEMQSRFFHRGDRLTMAVSAEYRNPFQDVRSLHTSINLPLVLLVRQGTVKWILKEIAKRYLPHSVVFRKKVAWGLPVEKYLEPLARPELFRDGFCSAVFGLHPNGLEQVLADWWSDLPSFFNLVQIEVWGRLFFLGESVDQVTSRVLGDGE